MFGMEIHIQVLLVEGGGGGGFVGLINVEKEILQAVLLQGREIKPQNLRESTVADRNI
jgi:hypothetical protein